MSLAAMVLADRVEHFARYYDRWVHLITFGRDEAVRAAVLRHVGPGDTLLDVGCGSGTLAVAAARQGSQVVGIDRSRRMLDLAREKATRASVSVEFREGEAIALPLRGVQFDVATATFVLSELFPDEAVLALRAMAESVRPGGKVIIADEAVPQHPFLWLLAALQRALLTIVAFTFAYKLAPTHRHSWRQILEEVGIVVREESRYQAGALTVLVGERPAVLPPLQREIVPLVSVLPRGLAGIVFRVAAWLALPIPVPPGVYSVGSPAPEGAVLLTGNFLATIDAVWHALSGIDCYLIVQDTSGWNVWCASDAGLFTAEKAAALIHLYRIEGVAAQRRVIIPRLGGRIRARLAEISRWEVITGPIEARDLPEFLRKLQVSPSMQNLDRMYRLSARLRVGALTMVQAPLLALPLHFLPSSVRSSVWRFFLVASWILPVLHYHLPGRTGIVKGEVLGIGASVAMLLRKPARWSQALAIAAVAPFIGWIYQSTSPVVYWKRLWK